MKDKCERNESKIIIRQLSRWTNFSCIDQHCQDQKKTKWMKDVEELRMMPNCQVFIMVLIQGATREWFSPQDKFRTNLFLFNFATKVPDYQVFTKAHFQFFHFFYYYLNFFGRKQAIQIMLLGRINHDMPKIQNDMLKDVDRKRKTEEKN